MVMPPFNRRQFVGGALALPFALRAMAEGERGAQWVLLGTDKGAGIYRAAWNAATGVLGAPELAVATMRPTYFAMHPKRPVLYAANEAETGDGSVSSFRVEARGGALEAIGKVSALGAGTCYVALDQDGKSAFAANYGGGSVAAFGVKSDGSLAAGSSFECKDNLDCGVTGPMAARQDAAHMHCTVVSPDNRYVLACNLGEDAIEVFPMTPGAISSEVLGAPTRFAARSGSGPRHVAFHPNGRWLYCIHELDCTIDVFEWGGGRKGGELTLMGGSTVSTLGPNAPADGNTACEIVVSHDGRFVYANTRGENSLTVYKVNAKTGMLTEQQRVQTGGSVTRLIAFDPSRQWLLCLNQGSSTVTVFAHEAKTGRLSEKPKTFAAESPMCVEWV